LYISLKNKMNILIIVLFILLLLFAIIYCILICKNVIFGDKNEIFGGKKVIFGGKAKTKAKTKVKAKTKANKWQLYTLEDCKFCDQQMGQLNGFNTYIKFSKNGEILENNIKGKLYPINQIPGYPFWYNTKTGETKMGKQDINLLTHFSKFE